MDTTLTITDIRKRFDKEKPKFIGLRNQSDQWEVPMNSPAIKPEVKMKTIENFFKKDSTPDGIYFVITKESITKGTPERVTPVAKGNVTLSQREIVRSTEPQTIHVNAEQVWDVKTAVEKLTRINQLEYEVKALTDENKDLRDELAELRAKKLEDGEEKKESMTGMMSGIKEMLEVVSPLVDKHLSLREEDIKLKRDYLNRTNGTGGATNARQLNGTASNTATRRTDGGVPASDPGYEDYFKTVTEEATDEQFNHELDYLERVNPNLYAQLCEKYEVDDNKEEEEEEDPNAGSNGQGN